ncbi:JDVT-CTERM system glutamic-type intramembrane protease [uncultured Pseudodesulfovibrio sp.]|uniref:JDVT-CTERM system glutamic-type intramembrane protease n=1 Tax=uncultured Pseudodesulfovibrio sp. TaxID=2035858 RepID=UPI0029C61FB7|nr:JDVT-CTERM system glutamic-type intramembrane protease [uncultured Pseudodesulfovibrio sp.]
MDSTTISPRGRKFYVESFFYAALLPACFGWLLPCHEAIPLWRILLLAFAEEALFRAGIQDWVENRGQMRCSQMMAHAFYRMGISRLVDRETPKFISFGNVCTSVLFALVHLVDHRPLWALGTFFPSLIFGALFTRYKRLLPCFTAHAVYNLAYFGLELGI